MPTENERKFVIDPRCEREVARLAKRGFMIAQGYLIATRGITVRVRKSTPLNSHKKPKNYFTMKANVGNRVVEIENKMDERDFHDLWDISLNKLEKYRYVIKDGHIWELDFFKDYREETYMAVAEVELPEGQEYPEYLPNFVSDHLLYEVELTDTRFSNKLLGDARYAARLLREIRKCPRYSHKDRRNETDPEAHSD